MSPYQNLYYVDQYLLTQTGEILTVIVDYNQVPEAEKISKKKNIKIISQWKISEVLNENCIINSKLINFYKLTPSVFEKSYQLIKSSKTVLGTSGKVNPIIYGETSISNIVKRYPIKFIFKPLMYISVILMIFYWYYNNLIINKIINQNIRSKFFIFGILSGIFLLLHVIFLGWVFETEALTKIRRSFVVFFIFFEVLAQAYLIRDIFVKKDKIFKYLNNFVVYCKLV